MRRGSKLILRGIGFVLVLLVAAAVSIAGLYTYVTPPIVDGAQLGDGAVTAVVTDHFGPIAMGAYLFELPDGRLGSVDSGSDAEGTRLKAALARRGKTASDVSVVLLTHGHDDHAGGAVAFPQATVYALAPDVDAVRRRRDVSGARGQTIAAVANAPLDVGGVTVQVFGLPGHTRGSAAYLVRGVLFLGDSAQSQRDGTLGPNTIMTEDGDATVGSLRVLAEKVRAGAFGIRHVAFGHSGPLEGADALLTWAATK